MEELEYEKQNERSRGSRFWSYASAFLLVLLVFTWIFWGGQNRSIGNDGIVLVQKDDSVTTELPAVWGDLGARMVAAGVIDRKKFLDLYAGRGGISEDDQELLDGIGSGKIKAGPSNAGFLLNLFWALGLSNENRILKEGPMADPRYGDPSGFASTGGWTLAHGNPMDHYSMHAFFVLSADQQELVERVSKNIYRPCCNNATHFPDCNHGMAMLGFLELMASQGAHEEEMYRAAFRMNSLWFPEQYATIARYFLSRGMDINRVDPRELLGASYSSGSGFQRIAAMVPLEEERQKPSGGCSA